VASASIDRVQPGKGAMSLSGFIDGYIVLSLSVRLPWLADALCCPAEMAHDFGDLG
jgi:hypothetical protein